MQFIKDLLNDFGNTARQGKFWALLTALAVASQLFSTSQIDAWQFVLAVIASTSTYALASVYANK